MLGFSEFNKQENNSLNNRKNKTRKNKDTIKSHKIQKFLDSIDNDDDDNNNGMYNLPKPPQLQSNKQIRENFQQQHNEEDENEINSQNMDEDVNQESFNNIQTAQNYYNNYIPYFQNATNNANVSGNKDLLIEKLNYMIQLLEDQQEEKTGHITEELILYSFLGVFVIFVIDSFARAGKYVR